MFFFVLMQIVLTLHCLCFFFFFRIQTLQHQAYSIVTVTKLNLTNEARLRKTYIFLMDFFHSVDNVVPDMI